MDKENVFYATGKRKCAIARTWIRPGSGNITINDRAAEDYFKVDSARTMMSQPLTLTNNQGNFDVTVKVTGGGINGQAGAIRHGLARALVELDETNRTSLKANGFLTRDARMVERKKYGQPGARKKFQFSKR